jgi:hypothetical protein
MATNNGTSTAAPRICMLARLNFVAIGIGGVGIKSGNIRESNMTTMDIITKTRAGRRTVLAMIRKTRLAPIQKMELKMITSVAGSGLTSGDGNCSGAMNSIPTNCLTG